MSDGSERRDGDDETEPESDGHTGTMTIHFPTKTWMCWRGTTPMKALSARWQTSRT